MQSSLCQKGTACYRRLMVHTLAQLESRKKKQWKLFSRSSRLKNTTCKKPFSHRHTPKTFFEGCIQLCPYHQMLLSNDLAWSNRDCQHTDCQHTNHYPKQSKAVLLSSTPQGSQLNSLGNPTESRNSPEPMAAPFQINYLVSSQPSPIVLNSKGTVTHPQSGSNTQFSLKQTNLTKIISGCMSKQPLCLDLWSTFSVIKLYIPWWHPNAICFMLQTSNFPWLLML